MLRSLNDITIDLALGSMDVNLRTLGSWSASAGVPGVIRSTTRWPAGGRIRKAMPEIDRNARKGVQGEGFLLEMSIL